MEIERQLKFAYRYSALVTTNVGTSIARFKDILGRQSGIKRRRHFFSKNVISTFIFVFWKCLAMLVT